MIYETVLFDAMLFNSKPDLGMSTDISFVYEWDATLKDEAAPKSAFTIEEEALVDVMLSRKAFSNVVIDIESLRFYHDPIAKLYVDIGKAALPKAKISWWNTGPGEADTATYITNRPAWAASFEQRSGLVDALDFGILGAYFRQTDTIQIWQNRTIPRIAEARKLYGKKPLFVTVAPHFFENSPWGHVPGELLGAAIDTLAERLVDGIALWSVEGTGQLQTWDENWPWVSAVRSRIGPDGLYKPA